MVKKCATFNIGFRRIAADDGGFLIQLLFTFIVVFAGVYLRLSLIQWTFVALLTFGFLFSGLYRSAAYLLTIYDDSISTDQAIRIKALGNLMLTFAAGISFFSYLLIFIPKINQLI